MRQIRARRVMAMLIVTFWCQAWLTVGCSQRKISDRDLVLIDPDEADQLLEGRTKLLGLGKTVTGIWIDPRGEAEYRAGHIPGAISLPFQNVREDHHRLRGYDVLMVYGNDYNDPKAQGMSKRLMELGFKDVRMLRGGLRTWTGTGRPLEESE
ncbi:MAG: rhodanese-like domain-containing protein [Planctomycetota bacterium]|jgi:3-mercaptopyruvate sulfurtransferase SseA